MFVSFESHFVGFGMKTCGANRIKWIMSTSGQSLLFGKPAWTTYPLRRFPKGIGYRAGTKFLPDGTDGTVLSLVALVKKPTPKTP